MNGYIASTNHSSAMNWGSTSMSTSSVPHSAAESSFAPSVNVSHTGHAEGAFYDRLGRRLRARHQPADTTRSSSQSPHDAALLTIFGLKAAAARSINAPRPPTTEQQPSQGEPSQTRTKMTDSEQLASDMSDVYY
jgi:hypothetical protein